MTAVDSDLVTPISSLGVMAVLSVQRWSSRQHAELHLFTEMFGLVFRVPKGSVLIGEFSPSSLLDFNWLKGNCASEMKDKVAACLSLSKSEKVPI